MKFGRKDWHTYLEIFPLNNKEPGLKWAYEMHIQEKYVIERKYDKRSKNGIKMKRDRKKEWMKERKKDRKKEKKERKIERKKRKKERKKYRNKEREKERKKKERKKILTGYHRRRRRGGGGGGRQGALCLPQKKWKPEIRAKWGNNSGKIWAKSGET